MFYTCCEEFGKKFRILRGFPAKLPHKAFASRVFFSPNLQTKPPSPPLSLNSTSTPLSVRRTLLPPTATSSDHRRSPNLSPSYFSSLPLSPISLFYELELQEGPKPPLFGLLAAFRASASTHGTPVLRRRRRNRGDHILGNPGPRGPDLL